MNRTTRITRSCRILARKRKARACVSESERRASEEAGCQNRKPMHVRRAEMKEWHVLPVALLGS